MKLLIPVTKGPGKGPTLTLGNEFVQRCRPQQLVFERYDRICGPSMLKHPMFCTWSSFSSNFVARLCMKAVTLRQIRADLSTSL
eukprot:3960283-Amphidinium_carterae.1